MDVLAYICAVLNRFDNRHMRKIHTTIFPALSIFLFCFVFQPLTAQTDGTNDPSFNPGDSGFDNGAGFNSGIESISIQKDNKIILTGSFTRYDNKLCGGILRFNADGTLDEPFKNNTAMLSQAISATSIQNSGKIIVTGEIAGITAGKIARFNTDGTLDASFQSGTGANRVIRAHILQPDDKIIVVGDFTMYDSIERFHIARLNADGSLDTTFNTGVGFDERVTALAIQSDGKIIIGGTFFTSSGLSVFSLLRLNSDGSVDPSFHLATFPNNAIHKILIQKDDKIIIAGAFTTYDGVSKNHLARLNADGIIDTTYRMGTGPDNTIYTAFLQPDGKLLISYLSRYNGTPVKTITRINTDGVLDTSFTGSEVLNGGITSIGFQSDNKIILGGSFIYYNGLQVNSFVRLSSGGIPETNHHHGTGACNIIYSSVVLPDKKIIIGGNFTYYNGRVVNHIARLLEDGTLDTTFYTGHILEDPVKKIVVQKDGKILVGTMNINLSLKNCIYRLNTDGTPDTAFHVGEGIRDTLFRAAVHAIVLQDDGKILIGGMFKQFDHTAVEGLIRLNANGTQDVSFNTGTEDYKIRDMVLLPDGKIIIVGDFFTFHKQHYGIARINMDGTLDTTFLAKGANAEVITVALQKDGKILIGGYFDLFNDKIMWGMARLNANGTLDEQVFTITHSPVNTFLLQEDGKILTAGDIGIDRLNTDTSVDFTFDSGTGIKPNSDMMWPYGIFSMNFQGDKLIVAGNFIGYNDIGRNRIARLYISNVIGIQEEEQQHSFTVSPNPLHSQTVVSVDAPIRNGTIKLIDVMGQEVRNITFSGNSATIERAELPCGVYFLQLSDGRTISACKKIVVQ